MTSSCTTCGAPILWCRTETGRRIPINPTPDPEGNLVLTGIDTPVPTAVPVGRAGGSPRKLTYKSHFATCPDSRQHRRGRNKPKPQPEPDHQPDLFTGGGQ